MYPESHWGGDSSGSSSYSSVSYPIPILIRGGSNKPYVRGTSCAHYSYAGKKFIGKLDKKKSSNRAYPYIKLTKPPSEESQLPKAVSPDGEEKEMSPLSWE